VTLSLVALAGVGLWARNGSFDAEVTDPKPMGAP
jgi:hypothetical protein